MPSSLQRARPLAWPSLVFELQAAGSIQNRTAAVDDLRHAADVHLVAFAVDQAVITALNAHHAVALGDACADNGAYRCIHAGGVAAAGQYTDSLISLAIKCPPVIVEPRRAAQ